MLPKRIGREIVYENKWVNLYLDDVKYPDGRIIRKYHFLHFEEASVGVVILDASGNVLLIRSSRYATQSEEWEIPAGGIEKDESPEQAAIRESEEETGCTVHNLQLLCKENSLNGMTDKVIYIYKATMVSQGEMLTPEEVLCTRWFSQSEIRDMIKRQEIHCELSLIGLLMILCGF